MENFIHLYEFAFSNISGTYYGFKFANLLQLPFDQWDIFKLGLIDDKGNIVRKAKTVEEKNAFNFFTNLVRKVKKILLKYVTDSRLVNILIGAYLLKKEEVAYGLEEELLACLEPRELDLLSEILFDIYENNY